MTMTLSSMLYWLDISTFYFYEPLLFQIFVLGNLYKNLGLPLSTITFATTTQLTIPIHLYICLYIYIYIYIYFYQKKLPEVFYKKSCSWKFCNIHRKTLVCDFIKKKLRHRCFPVNIAKILITPISKNTCEQLLLDYVKIVVKRI